MDCLIVFRSVTYAQNGQSYLARHHISGSVGRAPSNLARGGCSYALKIRQSDLKKALNVLSGSPVPFTGAYCRQGTGWREAVL